MGRSSSDGRPRPHSELVASMSRIARVVAPEYDEAACVGLLAVVQSAGGFRLWHRRGTGGSRDVESRGFLIGWRLLRIQRETYMGLSIAAPALFVKSLCAMDEVTSLVAVL